MMMMVLCFQRGLESSSDDDAIVGDSARALCCCCCCVGGWAFHPQSAAAGKTATGLPGHAERRRWSGCGSMRGENEKEGGGASRLFSRENKLNQ